jgi:hypothetical protein
VKAKQNNRIIESLGKTATNSQKNEENKNESFKDWCLELNELSKTSKKLRGISTDPAIFSPAFRLVKASIEFALIAVSNVIDQEELYHALNKVRRAYNKAATIHSRQE